MKTPRIDPRLVRDLFMITQATCPFCHNKTLCDGPQAGMSTNVICTTCNARFNIMAVPMMESSELIDKGYLPTGTPIPRCGKLWWFKRRKMFKAFKKNWLSL